MSPTTVAKRQPEEISKADHTVMEEKEQSAKASASAGLNLNIFGALAGAFSSKNSKETEADGSCLETKEENASISGAGAGSLNARGAASAEQQGRHTRAAIQEKNASQ